MIRLGLLLAFYLSVIGLGFWGVADYAVTAEYRLDNDAMIRGTWDQYGTQLLVQKGYWSEAANDAVRNTRPTFEATKAVLED